jgi:ADP-heptose:LPS heptosyltransferase
MAEPRFPILFITATRIGDAVLSSGLIKRLHDEIPHARFTIAAGPLAAPLFRDTPGLDRLIEMPKAKSGMHWFKLWNQVRARRWGLILDMRGSGISRFLRARRRAVRRSLPASLGPMHKVLEAARVLKIEDDVAAPFFFTSPETEARALALIGPGRPILAVAPAANWVGKTWPAERFAVLAAELLGPNGPMPGGRLMILGGPDDRWTCEVVSRSIPRERMIDLVGRIDLLTAYACLKHARLFIGNDSGLMHLAAAAGAPTLGLFGPSDDRLYGPWGPNARVVRGPREFEAFVAMDPTLSNQVCHMLDLPIEWVSRAARRLYAETEPEPVKTAAETRP